MIQLPLMEKAGLAEQRSRGNQVPDPSPFLDWSYLMDIAKLSTPSYSSIDRIESLFSLGLFKLREALMPSDIGRNKHRPAQVAYMACLIWYSPIK